MLNRTTSWNAPYTFSGKEKDVETGYGYFGARYYDSGLSIWLSVDPMSDKYPSMSPYNYCANNPVILVDPDGREIDQACKTEWNNQKQAIVDKKAGVDGQIDYYTERAKQKGWSEAKLNRKTSELKEQSTSLGKTLNTMNDLENSQSTTYTLRKVNGNGYFTKGYGDDAGKMVIAFSTTSSFVHEVTHGGQYHNKEVNFLQNGSLSGYDLMDEVNAYRAALAYDSYSYDNTYYSPSDITPDWVRNRGSGSHFPYKNLPVGPINAPMYKSSRKVNSNR